MRSAREAVGDEFPEAGHFFGIKCVFKVPAVAAVYAQYHHGSVGRIVGSAIDLKGTTAHGFERDVWFVDEDFPTIPSESSRHYVRHGYLASINFLYIASTFFLVTWGLWARKPPPNE